MRKNQSIIRWKILNWNKRGIPRTKAEALQNAADYLINKILTDEYRNKHNLPKPYAPRIVDLKAFYRALHDRNLDYNDVVRKANLELRPFHYRESVSVGSQIRFNNTLRYAICRYIIDSLLKESSLSESQLIERIQVWIKSRSYKKEWLEIIDNSVLNVFLNRITNDHLIQQHIKDLIAVVREMVRLIKNNEKITAKWIYDRIKPSFNVDIISDIINDLTINIEEFTNFFSNKELIWLKNQGVDFKKIISRKNRWYWVNEDLFFTKENTGTKRSGLELALEFFKKFIIKAAREKFYISLKEVYSPSANDLRSLKYNRLITILFNKMTLNDIYRAINIPIRRENIFIEMKINELKAFFINIIYPQLKIEYNIPKGLAPLLETIHCHWRGFENALYRKGLIYNFFIRELGFTPQQSKITESGKLTHFLINAIIFKSFEQNRVDFLKYFAEVLIFTPNNNKQIDGLLEISLDEIRQYLINVFDKNINTQNLNSQIIDILNHKRFLMFDFTNIIARRKNLKLRNLQLYFKIFKYHPNDITALFIVNTIWPDKLIDNILELPSEIQFNLKGKCYCINTKNVIVISPQIFAKIMNLKGDFLLDFNDVLRFNRSSEVESLFKLILKYKDVKTEGTDEFIEYIGKYPYDLFNYTT